MRSKLGIVITFISLSISATENTNIEFETQFKVQSNIELSVLTINIAHGRKTGSHQLLQSTSKIRQNLMDVSRAVKDISPDIISLQEADGPSFWSGNFNHVEFIAKESGYAFFERGSHVDMTGLDYGTALISKFPLINTKSIKYSSSFPVPPKGLLASEISILKGSDENNGKEIKVSLISLHLDPLRLKVRIQQIKRVLDYIKSISGPIIVMGDFNCEWSNSEDALAYLVEKSGLHIYQPDADNLATYPASGKRIDWILASPDFEFISYNVINEPLSDHLAVFAKVRMRTSFFLQ